VGTKRFDDPRFADPGVSVDSNLTSVTYEFDWDPETSRVEVYTIEGSSDPGAPPQTGAYHASTVYPGQSQLQVATTSYWYRRTIMVPYDKNGTIGRRIYLGPYDTTVIKRFVKGDLAHGRKFQWLEADHPSVRSKAGKPEAGMVHIRMWTESEAPVTCLVSNIDYVYGYGSNSSCDKSLDASSREYRCSIESLERFSNWKS